MLQRFWAELLGTLSLQNQQRSRRTTKTKKSVTVEIFFQINLYEQQIKDKRWKETEAYTKTTRFLS